MPDLLQQDDFKPHFFFSGAHFQTILPHLFRNVLAIEYERERFLLSDDDFVDLDWLKNNNKKLCLILHGLESSSDRDYIYGLVKNLKVSNFDVVVLNQRGCSGETNIHFKSYNSGFTEDTLEVLQYLSQKEEYEEINLIGVSMGGNISLKLAGEQKEKMNHLVNKIVAISVPCDLYSSAKKLQNASNIIYHTRFLNSLKRKLFKKLPSFPDLLDKKEILRLKTLMEFDNYYTAPAFGYKNALDYYEHCSSKPYIPYIKTPTLIITAKDDPFLVLDSMPIKEATENPHIIFINTDKGGHVGFMERIKSETYWHERMLLSFLE